MQIANRESFAAASRRRGWTNPYVTDGLVAMWDGEWNAGGGVHDASTGSIADLCGGAPFVLEGNGAITSNALSFNGMSARCNRMISTFGTVECCYRLNSGRIVFFGCVKYQTGNTTPDFYAIWNRIGTTGSPIMEICGRQNVFIGQPHYSYGARSTVSRCGVDAFHNGVLSNDVDFKNTWGNQSVITVGGRVSTTSYDGAGELYNLRVYSQELTAAEIAANYAIDKERFGLP